MTDRLSPTPRTRVRRQSALASDRRADLYSILDASTVCHLGVLLDGAPAVFPTGYGRHGDLLYLHGSVAARSLAAALAHPVCVCVTHLDGVVYARSLYNHTVNYRSAMVYGQARLVTDSTELMHGLRVLTEHLAPGQWDYARRPSRRELAATSLLAVPLDEASVKIRSGPPQDDEPDYDLPIWAGVVPISMLRGDPLACPRLAPGTPVPDHIGH
ncbi:MAG TPA: pyridoxamine 5'-phosphate oxidase family protein [Mycobacteriales bacterium]|nr:pyridoxamine 5'-phosphate oxidase family protein [Mycobacteriales bacterium]